MSNPGGGVSLLQSNTALTSDPGNIPDVQYRYISIKKRLSWLNEANTNSYNAIRMLPNNAGVAFITTTLLGQVRTAIIANLKYGQNLGMFQNVSQYEGQVTVNPDPSNPNNLLMFVPDQMTAQLNSGTITNNILSSAS